MEKRTPETRTKYRSRVVQVHSRVRIISVTVWAHHSDSERRRSLKWLNATGTIVNFDPRWTLPWRVKLDSGEYKAFAKDNLEVLEP